MKKFAWLFAYNTVKSPDLAFSPVQFFAAEDYNEAYTTGNNEHFLEVKAALEVRHGCEVLPINDYAFEVPA